MGTKDANYGRKIMNDHEKLLNTLRDLLKNSAYYWKKSLELPGDKQGFFMSGYSKGMRSAVDTLIKNLRLYIVWEEEEDGKK